MGKSFDPQCFIQDLIPWLVRFVHVLQTQQKCAETLNLGRDLFWIWRVAFDPEGKVFWFPNF